MDRTTPRPRPPVRLRPVPASAQDLEALTRAMLHRRFLGTHADPGAALVAARAWTSRVEPRARLLRVDVAGVGCGHVWLVAQGEDLAVVDLALDDAAHAAGVRDVLLDLARGEGARRLRLALVPGEPTGAALALGGGFEASAHQMRLDLTLPPEPDPDVDPEVGPRLELRPMGPDDYARWEADEVESYAEALQGAGESAETALRVSREEHAELLPRGLDTPDQHFFVGVVDDAVVGVLWLGTERPMVFVYDVVVEEAHRRRGHGTRLVRAAARWARERGSHALGLNVFGDNTGARALYESLGFQVVETFVARRLDP